MKISGKTFANEYLGRGIQFSPNAGIEAVGKIVGYCACSGSECPFIAIEIVSALYQGADVVDQLSESNAGNLELLLPTNQNRLMIITTESINVFTVKPDGYDNNISVLENIASKKRLTKKDLLHSLVEYDKALSKVEDYMTRSEINNYLSKFTSLHKGLDND